MNVNQDFQKQNSHSLKQRIKMKVQSFAETLSSQVTTVICVVGNDGTGKSTICKYINEKLNEKMPHIYCMERSHKTCPNELKPLLQQLKTMDLVTFNYAFEEQRKSFQRSTKLTVSTLDENKQKVSRQLQVFWFMLDLQPEKIRKRLSTRNVVDIYDSKKAVQYYSFIYREFAWYYGIPIIYADQPTQSIIQQIISWIDPIKYNSIYSMRFQSITLDLVNERNVENKVAQQLAKQQNRLNEIFGLVRKDIEGSEMRDFYYNSVKFKDILNGSGQYSQEQVKRFKIKLSARWLIKHGTISSQQNQIQIIFQNPSKSNQQEKISIQNFSSTLPYLKTHEQGQSKILFSIHSSNQQVNSYFQGKVIILLKSTIYSHTKQHTGEIANLGQIRALGNILFLQMMRRNNLNHAYLCINHENGIILSQWVQTNQLEIVFKKQCLGTDKHSYHNITQYPSIVSSQSNCYTSGVYIRLDWRNPNHFLTSSPNLLINLDPYYYTVQKLFGKQQFFKQFLTDHANIKPMGDKCITEDLVSQYVNTSKVKVSVLRVYTTFLYYASRVGLDILDGCMMLDNQGTVWSEINPDCMRVKSTKNKEDYDKDIWRYGGSAKKEQIVRKWTLFNQLFMTWFKGNRYHQTELVELPEMAYPYQEVCRQILAQNRNISSEYRYYYQQLSSTTKAKRLIGTIDISQGKPILVKSSVITETHSSQQLQKAFEHLGLLQDVVLVDIDAAVDKDGVRNNRKEISGLVGKGRGKVYAVGGGIRTGEVLDYYLNHIKCPKLILSSNLSLLSLLSPPTISQRIIVQLSINSQNQILTHGRTVNTKLPLIPKILQLAQLGVKTISITFTSHEGHLSGIPRKQLVDIYVQIPESIETVIIAGGIATVDDLRFIWGFKRCVPQLGSAIWKGKITVAQIYQEMVRFDKDGLVPALVKDQHNVDLGLVYLNDQALRLCCETRILHRYSRQHQKVMKKGQTSLNVFQIIDIKIDCDNDALIIQTKPLSPNHSKFCHKDQYSCFEQNQRKNTLDQIQSHILSRKQNGSGYSKRMMQNEGLAAMKIIEEVQELHLSQHNKVHQAADLMAHLLMYFNAHNISMQQITAELEKRSIDTIKLQRQKELNGQTQKTEDLKSRPSCSSPRQIGIIGGKHFQRIDKLTSQMLGIDLTRATNRSAKLSYQITNPELYNKTFNGQQITLVGIKSKDMSTIVAKNLVSACVNYSIMMENYPSVCRQIVKLPTPGIILALLGRKNTKVDPKSWTTKNKGTIICEYPFSVNRYFKELEVDEGCYTLIRVSGGTESYLAADSFGADYCDAIVESGKTVEENELEIVAVLEKTIYAGYYEAL